MRLLALLVISEIKIFQYIFKDLTIINNIIC
jgi:hypothetical protein